MDIARIGLSVDSRDLADAQSSLRTFSESAENMESSVRQSVRDTNAAFSRLSGPRSGVAAAAATATQTRGTFSRAIGAIRNDTGTVRNTMQQLSQVADMAAATGDPIKALSIQATDLLMPFGTIGLFAGIAASALVPLAANFLEGAEGAESFNDAAENYIDLSGDFTSAVDGYLSSTEDLTEKFGEAAGRARELYRQQANLASLEANEGLRETQTALLDEFNVSAGQAITSLEDLARTQERMDSAIGTGRGAEGMSRRVQQLDELADQLGTSRENAVQFNAAMVDLSRAEGPEQVADAMGRLVPIIEASENGLAGLSENARDVLGTVPEAAQAAYQAADAQRRLEEAASSGSSQERVEVAREAAEAAREEAGATEQATAALEGQANAAGEAAEATEGTGEAAEVAQRRAEAAFAAVEAAVTDAINTIRQQAGPALEAGNAIGVALGDGMVAGINARASAVTAAARRIAQQAEATIEGVKAFQREVGAAVDGIVGPETLGKIREELADVGQSARDAAGDVAAGAGDAAAEASSAVEREADNARSGGENVGKAVVDGLTAGVAPAPTVLAGPVRDAIDTIGALQGEARVAGTRIGSAIVVGMESGVRAGRAGVVAQARSIAAAAESAVRSELDIQSPSRVMHELGENSAQGMADGIEDAAEDVSDSAADMAEDARRRVEEQTEQWRDLGLSTVRSFVDGMSEGDLPGAISGFLSDSKGSFWDALGSGQSIGSMVGSLGSIGSTFSQAASMGGTLAGVGAALSSVMPVIGMVTTAVDLISNFSSSRVIDEGLGGRIGSISGGNAYDYTTRERSSFWGLMTSTSTDYSRNRELTQAIRNSAEVAVRNAKAFGDVLGQSTDGIRRIVTKFDVDSGEELTAAMAEYEDTLALATMGTRRYIRVGERASETMESLASSLQATNGTLSIFGASMGKSLESAAQSRELLDRIGGPGALASGADAYAGMLPRWRQIDLLQQQLRQRRQQLGISSGVTGGDSLDRAIQGNIDRGNGEQVAELLSIAPLIGQIDDLRAQRTAANANAAPGQAASAARLGPAPWEQDLADKRRHWIEINRLQGNIDRAREIELKMMPEHLRATQERIWQIKDEIDAQREAERQAADLQRARERREAAAQREAEAIRREQMGLQAEVWRMQGETARLRERELAQLDPMNRQLQETVWRLEDRAEAEEKAARAAEDAQRAEERLAAHRESLARELDGYSGFGTIRQERIGVALAGRAGQDDEVRDILKLVASTLRQIAANSGRQADDTSILVQQGAA